MGRELVGAGQRRRRGGEHQRVIADVVCGAGERDRQVGGPRVAPGDELGAPGDVRVRVPHHVDPLGIAEGVVLTGRTARHDAADAGLEAALDDEGEGGRIDVAVPIEGRDDGDIHAFEVEDHGPDANADANAAESTTMVVVYIRPRPSSVWS